MKKSHYPDDAHRSFVQREVAIMKMVNHPNCVRLYGVYETKEEIVLIMELVKGGELFERLSHLGTYTELVAVKVVREVCLALDYLHSNNIIHRDLKIKKKKTINTR